MREAGVEMKTSGNCPKQRKDAKDSNGERKPKGFSGKKWVDWQVPKKDGAHAKPGRETLLLGHSLP